MFPKLLLVAVLFVIYSSVDASIPIVYSQHVCENGHLTLSCPGGGNLQIVGGNYGRRFSEICRSQGNTNCISYTSLDQIKQSCHNQKTCTLWASNNAFGDPCYGTIKYLEVLYYCA